MTKYYIEHKNIDFSHLADWELEVLNLFKEITKICANIYKAQIETTNGGLYPKTATIDEIEDAAVPDKNILNPYTRVIETEKGLEATFYYDEFKQEIEEIFSLLHKASKYYSESGDKNYSKYLTTLADDLKKANFEASEALWLKIGNEVNVDIKLGPLETYQDKLFGIKKVFQSNCRIRDEEEYKNLTEYIELINAIFPSSPFAKDVSEKDFVVRIDKVVAMGGWHAELYPSSGNYPGNIDYYKYGVKAIIYTNNIIHRQPVMDKIVKSLIDSAYSDNEKLLQARSKIVILHEISETISKVKYTNAYDHLRNYRDLVVESYAYLMGVKSGALLVLKGLMNTEEYQYMLVSFMAQMLRGWFQGKVNQSVSVYADGYRLAFNYLLERDAMKIYDNRIQIDYAKMYSAIDNLTSELSQVILDRSPKSAEELFKKYSNEKELSKFEVSLAKLIVG